MARVEKIVRNALNDKKIVVATFLDLKGAYDSVNHALLIHKLAQLGLQGCILRWVKDFLQERSFSCSYGGEQSSQRPISRGVPQGSCLSPLLFNAFIHDLPQTAETIQTEFADDIAILTVGDDIQECTQRMQLALTAMLTYCAVNDLTLSTEKTKAMVFTRKQVVPIPLMLVGSHVEYVQDFKFLGVVLDSPRLTWHKHVEHVQQRSHKALNLLKAVSHHNWGQIGLYCVSYIRLWC